MPWKVIDRDCKQKSTGKTGSHVVVKKKRGGKTEQESCHTSEEKASAALRARYANEADEASERQDLTERVLTRLLALVPERIDECIIVSGEIDGEHVMAKTRDRNYPTRCRIVRELTDDGIEIVYFKDRDTGYAEGMNSHGIGVINAALAVSEDENEVKGKVKSQDGPRMRKALECSSLNDAIRSLVGYKGGIKGHTFIGSDKSVYSIEQSSEHNPIVTKLKPKTGFDVRTNHGQDHEGAGYTPDRRPDDYMSSKIRKAQAEVELAGVVDFEDVAPTLASQNFEKGSNYNMLRRVDKKAGMITTSQIAMNLPSLEFVFYYFPEEGTYDGIIDRTPDDYDPKINIRVVKYNEDGDNE